MNNLFLAQQAPEVAASPNPMIQLVLFGIMFLGLWFLMSASQRKRQKKQEAMISSLKTGDEVLTIGGIYGTITNIRDDRFVLKISDGAKLEINRSYIQTNLSEVPVSNKK